MLLEEENRNRRRACGNGGKVEGVRVEGQLSAVSIGPLNSDPVVPPPDSEVPAKAMRRQFSARYKLQILEQAQACTEPGEVGRLLRREGLYTSHLTIWRRAKREGTLKALEPKKRGRKAAASNPLAPQVQRLQRQVAFLEEELRKAHVILDVQGKVAGLLGLNFATEKNC